MRSAAGERANTNLVDHLGDDPSARGVGMAGLPARGTTRGPEEDANRDAAQAVTACLGDTATGGEVAVGFTGGQPVLAE